MTTIVTSRLADGTGPDPTLTLIAIVVLLILLTQKEIVSGLKNAQSRQMSQGLNIAIIPLGAIAIITIIILVFGT